MPVIYQVNRPGSLPLLIVAASIVFAGEPAFAKVIDKDTAIPGAAMQYKVVLPKDYDAAQAYPAILALPFGGPYERIRTPGRQQAARY
jgi:hypothetical protein